MDYQLKGLILNCTLKSYTITPTESANVLKVTMRFYGGYKYNSPCKRRKDRLRKKFLAMFRKDSVLVPIPFLEPGQFPHPVSLGGPVLTTMEAALLKQVHEIEEQIRGFCKWWDHLAQEAERAKKEKEQINNWVRDLLDQRADLRIEIWKMEGELDQLKEERSLEASGLSSAGLGVASSVSGLSKGASAGPSAPKKKKKGKQKRHPGLSLEERQEYYKAYLSYL